MNTFHPEPDVRHIIFQYNRPAQLWRESMLPQYTHTYYHHLQHIRVYTYPSTRFPVGWDYNDGNNTLNSKFWGDVLKQAETNPALQEALERVKILYELSKDER